MTVTVFFVGAGAAVSQATPRVTSVSFTNSPTTGDTYGFAARTDVRVDFDDNIQVAYPGSPQLALEVGSKIRQASYSFYGGPSVYFVYLVQAEDVDNDGIGVPADALSSNGASITHASDRSVSAVLEHGAVAADGARRVDGSEVAPPRIVSWFVQESPRSDDTYGPGEQNYAAFEFDRAVTVTGEPRLPIRVGERLRETTSWAHGVDSGFLDPLGTKLRLFYTVQPEDRDSDGISFAANSLTVPGGSITLLDRPDISANLEHGAVPDDPTRKVDGSLGAKVTSVSVVSSPDSGDTYTLGEAVEIALELDSPATFCGSGIQQPELTLEIGARRRQARRSGRLSCQASSLTFSYDIRPNDLDSDGVSIPENALTFNGRPLDLSDSSHEAVASDPDHKVDGSIAVAPKITGVSISNRPQRAGDNGGFPLYGDTYGVGAEIAVAVEFDKPVDVTGARPEVALKIGERMRPASLLRDRPQAGRIIRFFYVVQSDDADGDGIGIPADSLTLNGGTLTILGDASTDAILSHDAVTSEFKVDGQTVSPPRLLYSRIFINSGPLDGQTYGFGERIWPLAWLDGRPAVTGAPEVSLRIGSRTRRASH